MKKKYLSIEHKTLKDFGVTNYKELWEKAQTDGFEGLTVNLLSTFEKSSDKPDLFHAVFSTDSEDRHGDIVEQNWDLKNFKKNPVFLDSHNYDSITHIIGRVAKIAVKDGKLQGDIEFFMENYKGFLASVAAEKGFLNTTSVGFIPKEFDEKNGNILKSELLEISAVSVPANAEALFEEKSIKEVAPSEDAEVETPVEKAPEAEPEAPVETPASEVEPEVTPEPAPVVESPKAVRARVLSKMAREKTETMNTLRNAVKGLVEDGKRENSDKIYRALRNLEEQI